MKKKLLSKSTWFKDKGRKEDVANPRVTRRSKDMGKNKNNDKDKQ